MKKFILLAVAATVMVSCSLPTKLVNSSSYSRTSVVQPIAALFVDLDVSPEKITYFMMPSKSVIDAGYDNVVNTAVREALLANGKADVMVALETQVKYNSEGVIESITITGYPAKYVNFRNAGDDYLKSMPAKTSQPESNSGLLSKFGK